MEELYGSRYQSGSFFLINVGSGFHCLRSFFFLFSFSYMQGTQEYTKVQAKHTRVQARHTREHKGTGKAHNGIDKAHKGTQGYRQCTQGNTKVQARHTREDKGTGKAHKGTGQGTPCLLLIIPWTVLLTTYTSNIHLMVLTVAICLVWWMLRMYWHGKVVDVMH